MQLVQTPDGQTFIYQPVATNAQPTIDQHQIIHQPTSKFVYFYSQRHYFIVFCGRFVIFEVNFNEISRSFCGDELLFTSLYYYLINIIYLLEINIILVINLNGSLVQVAGVGSAVQTQQIVNQPNIVMVSVVFCTF